MSNLERPRHGWEGITNGGEIYGNKPREKAEENTQNIKEEMFNDMISNGMDRVMTYQIVYDLDAEQAKEYANRDSYNSLIEAGLPPEMAEKISYKSTDENKRTK